MESKIILIRHGESLGNEKGIFLGHTDWDLSPRGYIQAEAAAEYFRDLKISGVYSSDLLRAYNTALPHAKLRQTSVKTDPGLREIYLGDWECCPLDVLHTLDEYNHGWKERFGEFCPPGGEAVWDAGERMRITVEKIARENPHGTVIVASHAAAIRALYANVSGIPKENLARELPFPENASATTLIYDGHRLRGVEYSFRGYIVE